MDAVGLVNIALHEVGAREITAISDTTPAGIIAGDIYEFKRDTLLRQHPWNFATVRTRLSRLSVAPGFEYQYAFRLPSDWLRTVSVNDNDAGGGALEARQESIFTEECITNGAFDTDTSWTKGTGWTIANGVASHASGTGSDLSQSATLTATNVHRVIFTISGMSAGTITPKFTGGTTVTGTARSADGTYVEELTAVTGNITFVLTASSDFNGSIDNVSVVDMAGTVVAGLVTNATDVFLRYIRKVTVVDTMSQGFQQALVYLLAKTFAIKPASSNTLRQLVDEDLKSAVRMAKSIDGIEDYPERFPEGSWAASRRRGGSWSFPR